MTKAKILLVLAYIVVCAAGVVVGTAVDWHVRPAVSPPPRGPFDAIHLTPDQEKQVRGVWDQVSQQRGAMFRKRHEFDDQRWAAIEKLFTPDQKQQFDQIQDEYHRQTKDQEEQLSAAVAHATDLMKQILTPDQYNAWEKIRKDHGFGHDKHGPGMGPPGMGSPGLDSPPGMGPPGMGLSHGHHRHGSTRPTTEPTTDPV